MHFLGLKALARKSGREFFLCFLCGVDNENCTALITKRFINFSRLQIRVGAVTLEQGGQHGYATTVYLP